MRPDLRKAKGKRGEVITGAQIRQARKLVGWSVARLGRRAKLAASTVHRAECVDGEPPITEAHAAAIRYALERAGGVEFTNGDEPGVKLNPKGERAR
jgi:transcriptional regulator with XRE-family HTH domain